MRPRTGIRIPALLLAVIIPALVSLTWPLGPDQAILTTVGRTWLEGSSSYVGAIDTKGDTRTSPICWRACPGLTSRS
jgi:hypothetical protein